MEQMLKEFPRNATQLLPEKRQYLQPTYQLFGSMVDRFSLIRKYMLSLNSENLLRNYLMEAGLWSQNSHPDGIHWGWESPTSQLRGHFLGHWLSGAAQLYAETGDIELKGKADFIVAELARCQQRNGGEWVFSIPEKYLDWIGRGENVWAPQYTVHKTLMGLWDMYTYAGNQQALEILYSAARWFIRWSEKYTKEEFQRILVYETGGMLEIWANLYGESRSLEYLTLLNRYWRDELYNSLIDGMDELTNLHANTTIPEIIGAARAYEVTGEDRWKKLVEAYWRLAVTERGTFVTGGQTSGEAWTAPFKLSTRMGKHNQEHCTVYNMMRLADILYRWTGETIYADYWERNLYNGLLAQENPQTGMVAYYLPMEAGNCKKWGTPTNDFWCCHGSLVQAPALIPPAIFHRTGESTVVVSQYLSSCIEFYQKNTEVKLDLGFDADDSPRERPMDVHFILKVLCDKPTEFTLKLRVPWWTTKLLVYINGNEVKARPENGYISLNQKWNNEIIRLVFQKKMVALPIPGDQHTIAFMDGPIVLAGLCDADVSLLLEKGSEPEELLMPHDEFSCECWRGSYKTKGQNKNIVFVPLHTIVDEPYSIYFSLIRK